MNDTIDSNELDIITAGHKIVPLDFILTNVRSLTPKIDSLISSFTELDLHFAVITESWLKDNKKLRDAVTDLSEGNDINMITYNRKTKRGNRTAGGGIAIAFNKNMISLKELKIRRGKLEILCAVGKLPNISRKIMILGIYIRPGLNAEALECLSEAIANVKTQFRDPYIVVTGDVNRTLLDEGIQDYPDLPLLNIGPTHRTAALDVVATNLDQDGMELSTLPPLSTKAGLESDHDIIRVSAKIRNSDRFSKNVFYTRKRTKKADKAMCEWIRTVDWANIMTGTGTEEITESFLNAIEAKMDELFPFQRTVIKSSDVPWMTREIKKKVWSRKRTYRKDEKRSERWKTKKKGTDELVRKAKKGLL